MTLASSAASDGVSRDSYYRYRSDYPSTRTSLCRTFGMCVSGCRSLEWNDFDFHARWTSEISILTYLTDSYSGSSSLSEGEDRGKRGVARK